MHTSHLRPRLTYYFNTQNLKDQIHQLSTGDFVDGLRRGDLRWSRSTLSPHCQHISAGWRTGERSALAERGCPHALWAGRSYELGGARAPLEAGSRRSIENLAIANRTEKGCGRKFSGFFCLLLWSLLENFARGIHPPCATRQRRSCGMGDPFTGDQRGHQHHDEGRGLLFSWLTSLRISAEDAREYTNALVALGFDDLQSIREVRAPKKYVCDFSIFLAAPVVEPADALRMAVAGSLPGVGSCSKHSPPAGSRVSLVSCAAVARAFGLVRSVTKRDEKRGSAPPKKVQQFFRFFCAEGSLFPFSCFVIPRCDPVSLWRATTPAMPCV